jgi:hypothetical protein
MIVVLDESGTHKGSRAIAVAGFVIAKDKIALLGEEWNAILAEHEMRFLHMRDFVPPYGKHSNKSPKERDNLFAKLIAAIHRNVVFGLGAAIELDEFMADTYENALTKRRDLVDSPYEHCVRHCFLQVLGWARERQSDVKFTYFIEQGAARAEHLKAIFGSLKKDKEMQEELQIEEVRFVTKKEFPLTQCADLLAYEIYKELDRKISQSPRATRESLMALYREENDRIGTIDVNHLRNHLGRGAALIEAQVQYLSPELQFKVRCFGLRSLTEEKRETLFTVNPAFRELWRLCLATGELGMPLGEVDPKFLPPNDPELLRELMKNDLAPAKRIP